jgi:hypothetical protein
MPPSSRSTPLAAHAHSMAVAVIANIGSGTGSPGLSRFQSFRLRIISTTQIIEPAISRNAPP